MKTLLIILIFQTFQTICQSEVFETSGISAGIAITIPFTNISTVAHRRVRRRYIVRCCGGRSCSYSSRSRFSQNRWVTAPWPTPDRDVDMRGADEMLSGDRAVATLRDGGVSISCPGCAPGWQQQLKISPEQGHIPIVCPGCDAGWRQWISQDAYASALDATTTAAPDENAHEGGEFEDETEKPAKSVAPKHPKSRTKEETSKVTKKLIAPSTTPHPLTDPPDAQTPITTAATNPPPTTVLPQLPRPPQIPTTPLPPPPPTTQRPPPPTSPPQTLPPPTPPPLTLPPPPALISMKPADMLQAGQSMVEGMVKIMPANMTAVNVNDMANAAGEMAKSIPGATDVLNTFGKLFG